jgi:hypothetical protein
MNDKQKLKTLLAEHLPALHKVIFNEDAPAPAAEEAPKQFGTAKTTDGKELKWEGEMGEGVAVMVVTADGEIPAPDGEHTLEDGTVLMVSGGAITKVSTAPAPEVMNAEQVTAAINEALSKQAEVFNKQIAELKKSAKEAQESGAKKFEAIVGALELIAELESPKAPVQEDPRRTAQSKQAMGFARLQGMVSKLSTDKN